MNKCNNLPYIPFWNKSHFLRVITPHLRPTPLLLWAKGLCKYLAVLTPTYPHPLRTQEGA